MSGNRGPIYRPTDKDRKEVQSMSAIGLTAQQIGKVKGIAKRTVMKHFKNEISMGYAQGIASLAQTAHQQAVAGNTAMLIFLLKTRMGWREVKYVDEDGNPIPNSTVNVNVDNRKQQAVLVVPGIMTDEEEWARFAKVHADAVMARTGKAIR